MGGSAWVVGQFSAKSCGSWVTQLWVTVGRGSLKLGSLERVDKGSGPETSAKYYIEFF